MHVVGNSRTQNKILHILAHPYNQAPDNPGFHHNIAPLLLAQGDRRSAIYHYRRAFHLNPGDINSKHDLAMVLWGIGKWEATLALLCQVVAVDDHHFQGHLNLAGVYYSKGQYDLAAHHARKATHIRPRDAMAHRSLGQVLDQMGNSQQSLFHRKIAIRRGPGIGRVSHPQDALTYKKVGVQLLSRASPDKDNGYAFMDAYRALTRKHVELENSERTREILQKCLR